MSTTDRIHISNNLDNLDNEWGFYIDLENLLPVLPEQYQPKHDYDYEYFAEHYDDFDNGYDDYYNTYVPYSEGKSKYIPENVVGLIARISSTTILTAALTYVIFFIL